MLKISISDLEKLYAKIAEDNALYIPADKNGVCEYSEWEDGLKVNLTTVSTEKSPKEFFFPQSEDLATFKTQGKSVSVKSEIDEKAPFVIFGMRACDLKGLEVLDRVFLSEPVDTFYKNRRTAGTIVTLACREPEESCFCTAFGINPASPLGDVTCWLTDDSLCWKANTEKGEALTQKVKELLTDGDEKEVEKEVANINSIIEKLPLKDLDPTVFLGKDEKEIFKSPNWDELYKSCLGCGTCTFVCPTCQCYDIRDYKVGDKVLRFRCWDSCMYSDFTKMAHGNPRTSQKERFRQRFMHKLVYFPINNENEFSCVGCGRCVRKCPVKANIAGVIKKFGGVK